MSHDGRLMGQAKYLQGATLVWKQYPSWSPDCDQDHCVFCFTKFMNRDDVPDPLSEGDAAQGTVPQGRTGYHWICADCGRDFKERFEWTVVGGPLASA